MATKPWGAHVGYGSSLTPINSIASLIGASPVYVGYAKTFAGTSTAFSSSDFSTLLTNGYVPVFTWLPNDNSNTIHIANTDVTGGTYDTLINSYANGIKALSGTVYLRLAHEANGNWYDWSPGTNSNTYTTYVAMWQYVWNKFQAAGVTNVKWVWCMNVHWGSDTATYAQLYPGDSYVDVIALDGYNFGELYGGWKSYSTVYASSVTDIASVAPSKTLCISEIGCPESIGINNKPAWIEDALHTIGKDSRISFFLWYEGTDAARPPNNYRLDSSTNATLAFQSALVTTTSFNRF